MPDSSLEAVELRRANNGTDLETALEAAQNGRYVKPEEPASEREARAISDFVDVFSASIEAWSKSTPARRRSILEELGTRLQALEREHLFVHWGRIEVAIEQVAIPVAILTVDRAAERKVRALLPRQTEVRSEAPPTRH